jgi:4-amino-4-deoxy-L-arabinose transferase-like glycosyltransferase
MPLGASPGAQPPLRFSCLARRLTGCFPWLGAPVLAVAVTALLRWPFLDAPLTADEGGYGEVARLWAHGRSLYGSVWVDRPQGLIVIFRTAIATGLGSPVALRCLAMGVGALVVVGAMSVGSAWGGRGVGLAAGIFVATAGASPFIEGFTLSGELLASALATAAVAAFLYYERTANVLTLVAAGLAGGSAIMVKQSAFDAVLAVAGYLLISRRRRAFGPSAIFATAAALPVAVAVLLAQSWRDWLEAVVFYGAHASLSVASLHAHLSALVSSLPAAAKALAPVALLACVGWRRSPVLARIWLATAAAGVCLGSGLHPHYYIELVVPLALLAAFGVVDVASPARRRAIVVGAAAFVVAWAVPLWSASDKQQAAAIWPHDPHLQTDGAVAAYVRQHSAPSQRIYVMWAAADIYYLADRAPSYRYLWLRNLMTIKGAVANADRMLARRTPALVVEAQRPAAADPTGRSATILERDYRLVAVIDGVPILRPRRN